MIYIHIVYIYICIYHASWTCFVDVLHGPAFWIPMHGPALWIHCMDPLGVSAARICCIDASACTIIVGRAPSQFEFKFEPLILLKS